MQNNFNDIVAEATNNPKPLEIPTGYDLSTPEGRLMFMKSLRELDFTNSELPAIALEDPDEPVFMPFEASDPDECSSKNLPECEGKPSAEFYARIDKALSRKANLQETK